MKSHLNDTQCHAAKAKADGRVNKLNDGGGLYLFVYGPHAKNWVVRYKRPLTGREAFITLKAYPDEMTLKQARDERDRILGLIDKGTDPQAERAQKKEAAAIKAPRTFRNVAQDWFTAYQIKADPALGFRTLHRNSSIIEHLKRLLGDLHIEEITTKHVAEMVAAVRLKISAGMARRCVAFTSRILTQCIADGILQFDVSQPVCRQLAKEHKRADQKRQKRPAVVRSGTLTQKTSKVAALWRNLCGYNGLTVRRALQFLMLTLVRPGEVANAEWKHIDLDEAVWVIPADKMKMREEHHIPLSRQALAILREMAKLTGKSRWVFSAGGTVRKYKVGSETIEVAQGLSENTLNKALQVMGYDTATEQCAHGFRSVASTLLNEELREGDEDDAPRWPRDAIELQLAHREGDTRSDYNEAALWKTRIKMMQHWADRLDGMRGNVVPIRRVA